MIEPRPTRSSARRVVIEREDETTSGWRYGVRIVRGDAEGSTHTVTLSWADHDDLVGGGIGPSKLVEAVVSVLLRARGDDGVPARFDVSTVRRWVPDLPDRLASMGVV